MDSIVSADHADWPQRQLILLDGERDWGLQTAAELIAERQPERLVWISNDPIPDRISADHPWVIREAIPEGISRPRSRLMSRPISRPISRPFSPARTSASRTLITETIAPAKVQRLLGGECDLLVMDLWTGLDADALGAAVGSLRGGGLLLLLTPGLADWPSWVDPEAARIAVHPYSAADMGARFIARLAWLLQTCAAVERLDGPDGPDGLGPKVGADARHPNDAFALQHLTIDQLSAALTPGSSTTTAPPGCDGSNVHSASPPRTMKRLFHGKNQARWLDRSGRSAGKPRTNPSAAAESAAPQSADRKPFDAEACSLGNDAKNPCIDRVEQTQRFQQSSQPPVQVVFEPLLGKQARLAHDRAQPATADQAEAIAAIFTLAAGRVRRPLVLTADRGRGKSAALGIAAGRLIAKHRFQVIVSAPRRSAVDTLFEHARAALRAESATEAEPLLSFQAPDALLAATPATDLLLIDEAAGIPAPLLEQLLRHYGRICFATTVHGYEGSGRGFEIRFRALLDQRTPGWQALRLTTPIRWSQGDSLERLINQLLLLDAEPALDTQVAAADLTAVQFVLHDRAALAENEPLLRQLFGLLLLGHYQTRPNDLRHLLDGPNLEVASLHVDGLILATALIAREGRLEPELTQPIFEGRRRPRGHLLPQTLSAHAGLREAPRLDYARIVRIAVHPAARRRGLGRRLIEAVAMQARQAGLDLLGASFGASTELLRFWHRCGLAPLHLGTRRNAASGARAAVVLQALSPAGAGLIEQARQRLDRDLPILLTGPLQDAEPALIAALLWEASCQPQRIDTAHAINPLKDIDPVQHIDPAQDNAFAEESHTAQDLDAEDWQQIDAFADAHRGVEATLPALARLVRARLAGTADAYREATVDRASAACSESPQSPESPQPPPRTMKRLYQTKLSTPQRDLLILSILQRRNPQAVIATLGLSGRAEWLQQLREAIAALRSLGRQSG